MSKLRFRIQRVTKIYENYAERGRFAVQLHCDVHALGSSGAEAFAVTVASPEELTKELEGADVLLGRGLLIAAEFDEALITQRLQRLLEESAAESWDELNAYVGRFFDWI